MARIELPLGEAPGGFRVGIYVDTPDPAEAREEPQAEGDLEGEESGAVVLRFPDRECA